MRAWRADCTGPSPPSRAPLHEVLTTHSKELLSFVFISHLLNHASTQESRTKEGHCGTCDAGYHVQNSSKLCVAWDGTCYNGTLIEQASRAEPNQCGQCNVGFTLSGTSCKPNARCSTASDVLDCIAPLIKDPSGVCGGSECTWSDFLGNSCCADVCSWSSTTPAADQYLCNNGELCEGALCCSSRLKRAKCPRNLPNMCASPTSSEDGSDYGCRESCDQHGGNRPCAWNTVLNTTSNDDPGDAARTLGLEMLPSYTLSGGYWARLDWDGEYAQFKVSRGSDIFSQTPVFDLPVTDVRTSDNVFSTVGIGGGAQAQFCHTCMGNNTQPKGACWGLLPLGATHRECGCLGTAGIYYGGYNSSGPCQHMSGFVGARSNSNSSGEQAPLASMGFTLRIHDGNLPIPSPTGVPTASPTKNPTTVNPTASPTTARPTGNPTESPTEAPKCQSQDSPGRVIIGKTCAELKKFCGDPAFPFLATMEKICRRTCGLPCPVFYKEGALCYPRIEDQLEFFTDEKTFAQCATMCARHSRCAFFSYQGQELTFSATTTPTAAPTDPKYACINDDTTADSIGATCTSRYDKFSSDCGTSDDADFNATKQCCSCKAGHRNKATWFCGMYSSCAKVLSFKGYTIYQVAPAVNVSNATKAVASTARRLRARDIPSGACATLPCAHGGTCTAPESGGFSCSCTVGFAGERCTEQRGANNQRAVGEHPVIDPHWPIGVITREIITAVVHPQAVIVTVPTTTVTYDITPTAVTYTITQTAEGVVEAKTETDAEDADVLDQHAQHTSTRVQPRSTAWRKLQGLDDTSPYNASEWVTQRERTCFDHVILNQSYTRLEAAKSACARDSKCSGVHDSGCYGDKRGLFRDYRLCLTDYQFELSSESPRSCVHKKPGTTHADHWSARIAGKWCSAWCCCARNDTTDQDSWRGEHCDDANECASSPCKHGGTCSESSTDDRVNDYYRKYRCECPTSYQGHECQTNFIATATSVNCLLMSMGVENTRAETQTLAGYRDFQVMMTYMNLIATAQSDFHGLCKQVFERESAGGV